MTLIEILETERLRLRPLGLDDYEAVHSWASDPENTRFMAWGPNTEEQTYAPCAAVNYGSYRIMERNGMRREALHVKAFWARVNKEWIDEEKVKEAALAHGCKTLRLLTSNDNLNAIGFYQKRGFELVGVNIGAIAAMDKYAIENGYEIDINDTRRHHEIYISDPRRTATEKLKTVLRHPIRRA